MKYNLLNITNLTSGVYLKPSPLGTYSFLNAKHFNSFGSIDDQYFRSTSKVELVGKNLDHVLEDEDLLLVAKGDKNKVCYYSSTIGKAVASSTFIVLKCNKDIVKPKFLHWLLNSHSVQKRLSKLSKGTHVKSISIKVLSKLEVSIPSLELQEHYIKLNNLIIKERDLHEQLIKHKEHYYNNLLIKKLNEHGV